MSQSKNVLIRLAQYERYLDDTFQLNLARIIVKAKIRNGRKVILRYMRNYPEIDFSRELELIETTLKNLDRQNSVNSLMGSEGIATAGYFKAFGKMFRSEFTFETRTRRPPKDPVNAILSFGYTLLTNEILALVIAHGLDPYIGFLHGVVYGRPSLALDLVEEFRHPVIDRFVLNLFNRNILNQSHFKKQPEEGIYLTDEGKKIFFHHYDKLLKKPVFGKQQPGDLRALFKRQVRQMAATIKNASPYKPFQFKV